MVVKRKKQANGGAKVVRPPEGASWVIRMENRGPAGTSISFLQIIIAAPFMVRARNGPVTAGDEPQ